MEHGTLTVNKNALVLARFLQDTMSLLMNEARLKGIPVTWHLDSRCPNTVNTDPQRLRQIVFNLVSNALKFTPKGGTVTLSVSMQSNNDQEGDPELLFKVEDNGPGISAELLAKLFEPFTQGDTSISRRTGGTGLGLAITKQLVELLGGRIWVDTELCRGSKFYFTLPTPAATCDPTLKSFFLQTTTKIG
jgi:signal transduction histidine kinase